MAIKKGASPAQIIEIIQRLIDGGVDINSDGFKMTVISTYNSVYSKTSKDTIIANLRENAMIEFQEDRLIVKLPQDNNKVDLMSVKIIDGIIDIRISQQKGNNASFNSSSLSNTLSCIANFIHEEKVCSYFNLLPDNLNPIKTNLPYKVEVIIGMVLACGENKIEKNGNTIKVMSNDEYLSYMGITNIGICEIDYWVIKELRKRNHEYDAVDKCENFDIIYDKCVNMILNDRN
jgi:hypothetical protein